MSVSYEEFVQWKQHGVSIEFRQDVTLAIESIATAILNRQTADAEKDQYLRGALQGLRTLIDWQPKIHDRPQNKLEEVDFND